MVKLRDLNPNQEVLFHVGKQEFVDLLLEFFDAEVLDKLIAVVHLRLIVDEVLQPEKAAEDALEDSRVDFLGDYHQAAVGGSLVSEITVKESRLVKLVLAEPIVLVIIVIDGMDDGDIVMRVVGEVIRPRQGIVLEC